MAVEIENPLPNGFGSDRSILDIINQLESSEFKMDTEEFMQDSALLPPFVDLNNNQAISPYQPAADQFSTTACYFPSGTDSSYDSLNQYGSNMSQYSPTPMLSQEPAYSPAYQNQDFARPEFCNGNSSPESSLSYTDLQPRQPESLRSTHTSLSDTESVELNEDDICQMHHSEETASQTSLYVHTGHCLSTQQERNLLPHFHEFLNYPRATASRRGRPRTFPRCSETESDEDDRFSSCTASPPRGRRGAKNVLLWKFLLEELCKGEAGQVHIKWMDRRKGLFRFIDTTEVSRLWGMKKKKHDMNFEKLSRGIRHYYRDGLMSRQEGTRLVYQFNWERVPRQYRNMALNEAC